MQNILPNLEALQALGSSSDNGPVVMLNLLKFQGSAGAAAYARYGAAVNPLLTAHGACILYMGRAAELLIGSEPWDAVALVEYPSRQAFLAMIASPEYQAIHTHREQGLERTVLYATTPLHNPQSEKGAMS